MRAKPTVSRACFVLFAVVCLGAGGCKRSQEQAKVPTLTPHELNLGDLTPAQKKESADRLAWNYKNLVGDYDRLGPKNAKWDKNARHALELFAQVRAYGPDVEGFPHALQYDVERAVENGCNDPLVRYLYTRYRSEGGSLSAEQINHDAGEAADQLAASGYASVRKYYGDLRAFRAYFGSRKNNPANNQAAVRYFRATVDQFFAFLEETDQPVGEVDDACEEFLTTIKNWNTEKDLYDRMEALLLQKWPKAGFTYYLRGKYYTEYAWKGRTGKTADKVTPEQWKLFRDRLAIAATILSEGATNAPTEGRIPAQMINVVAGQEKGFPEMQHWFERAMEADTNNFIACEHMIYFLLPRWFGSREAMVEFGHRCLDSDKWGGTVPLALVEAHYTFNRYDGAPDGSYWQQPDVWPDIKAAYEKFFARNPNAKRWRSYYARYAYWCRQPEALRQQLDLAGDNIDEEAFGGSEYYYQAVAWAKQSTAAASSTASKP